MAFFPVIMCGGSGARLWPASRPSRPKQFIALAGNRSLFQDTVARVADLVTAGGCLIVIGGVAHGETIADQLLELGIDAHVLLEPQARDSAAAMAAAAAWVQREDAGGLIGFVASDHYIPDGAEFRRAVDEACASASLGRIVTLGVRPTHPSSAYGYVKPTGPGISAIKAFHEKPDAKTAADLIAAGFLWNSGNFIVSAATLVNELRTYAPAVLSAAIQALPERLDGLSVQKLEADFLNAPKISIDYAVMERTRRATVLPVDFDWSDLGAWDAIAETGEGSTGARILEDADRVLTRAPDGVIVAALGVRDLAIIVEADAVLVCDINRAQEVKRLVERVRIVSPTHLDFERPAPESLVTLATQFADWLRLRALPVWSTLGFGEDGGFRESLTLTGKTMAVIRRARVQTRQIFVCCHAGSLGWQGPWKAIATSALSRLRQSYLRPDGAIRGLLSIDWTILDDSAPLYDQAFALFSLYAAKAAGLEDEHLEADAIRVRETLLAGVLPNGAMKEVGDQPYQSNAHMHLFEAALAWSEISDEPGWADMADRIANLAMTTFIDPDGGFLREYFTQDWRPADGDDGRLVEPGHQFEWAWLMTRYGRARKDDHVLAAARALYAAGRRGVAHRPPVAIDAMDDDLKPRNRRARLWPQTEWLKAALLLSEDAEDGARQTLLDDAAAAMRALNLYLTEDGLWRDKRLPNGEFIDEPAPASSFYHIMSAFGQLRLTLEALDLDGGATLDLG